MKNRKLIVSFLLFSILGLPVVAAVEEKVEAVITNYDIMLYGANINYIFGNPILSYNDHTYVSLRDFIKLTDYEILWDEGKETITLQDKKGNLPIISKKETALAIAKEVLKEHYPDEPIEDMDFIIWNGFKGGALPEEFFEIRTIVSDSNIDNLSDEAYFAYIRENTVMKVIIDSYTGEITIERLQ